MKNSAPTTLDSQSAAGIPPRVQPFVAMLCGKADAAGRGIELLEQRLGTLDFRGRAQPFHHTRYYEVEMGPHLNRSLFGFSDLISPLGLVDLKLACLEIERELAGKSGRRVNLDPGYVDLHKVVLASVKPRGHKLYLDQGIWADLTLLYQNGAFRPLEWTFPDFRDGSYDADLRVLRTACKQKQRNPAGKA